MAIYRSGYGDASYGTFSYGLSGAITDAVSIAITSSTVVSSAEVIKDSAISASASSSVTCSAGVIASGAATATSAASVTSAGQVVVEGAAAVSCSASVVSAADVVIDGAANMSLQNVVVTVAETYAETDGYRIGYGLRTYGTNIYGENHRVIDASASISATSGTTANAVINAVGSATIAGVSSTSANGEISVTGSAVVRPALSVSSQAAVTRNASSSDVALLIFTSSARKKWEDEPEPSDTWTDATDSDIVAWTDAPVRQVA